MTFLEFAGLFAVDALCVALLLIVMRRDVAARGFNFHAVFTLIYALVFFAGFPLSSALFFGFGTPVPSPLLALLALVWAGVFYGIYYAVYRAWPARRGQPEGGSLVASVTERHARLTAMALALVAAACLAVFLFKNGLLLFKLEGYYQIFSKRYVAQVALKRFFYFFIPAMVIVYFLRRDRRAWFTFLASTASFGLLTYIAVGGTRANLALAFALFLFIGLIERYLRPRTIFFMGALAIGIMFCLALGRYHLNLHGADYLRTFLYMTRDTFSPWENLALIMERRGEIEPQGIMPIVRDFYVFIPRSLWPGRPDVIVNTGVYFTHEVLGRSGALVMSPTLLGSLLIMGGPLAFVVGAVVVGALLRGLDRLYELGRVEGSRGGVALVMGYCLGAVFNVIILVREGIDAFVSRMVFFSVIFAFAALLAWGLGRAVDAFGAAQARPSRRT